MGGDVRKSDVDGGWAWVALSASVLTMAIMAAFDTSHGIFQAELRETFSGSQGLVALIFSLALGGRFLLGPVSGIISDLVTHRAAIMIGGALLCTGLAAASLSNDLVSILFFLGIVCGAGSGLSFTASVTVVSNYFRKYRTVAFGISLAAPGLGLVCGPYLLRWLIVDYGWRLAMACFACILAQICVLGALYFKGIPCFTCCSTSRPPTQHKNDPETEALHSIKTDNSSENSELKHNPNDSSSEYLQLKNNAKDSYSEEFELKNNLKDSGSYSAEEDSKLLAVESALSSQESDSILSSNSSARSAEKQDGSVASTSGSSQEVKIEEEVEDVTADTQDFRQRIKLLLSKKFLWVICVNQMMMTAGFATALNFYPAYIQSVGVAFRDLPTLYTVYGITLMVTRVAGGFIFNRFPNHMLKGLFVVQMAFALVQSLLPLYGVSFPWLMVERFLTGTMYGASLLFVTPILDRTFGPRNLPVAFGIVMLCSGVGSVTAPPIAGILYDIYGTYNVCCYLSGAAGGISALSLLFSLCIKTPGHPKE